MNSELRLLTALSDARRALVGGDPHACLALLDGMRDESADASVLAAAALAALGQIADALAVARACLRKFVGHVPALELIEQLERMTVAAPTTDEASWHVGHRVAGRWEVFGSARGGMGDVYFVRDTEWNIDLAVKTLRLDPGLTTSNADRARQMFRREARTWLDLGLHSNVVTGFYTMDIGGALRFFMEYVPGRSLARCISDGGGHLPLTDVLAFGLQIAAGMAHVHAQGVVHRDLKPHNLLVSSDGRVRVTDFGLGKFEHATDHERERDPSAVAVSAAAGTPLYMAPEQWRALGEAGTAADVYALGVTLYEMVTGKRPFDVEPSVRRRYVGRVHGALAALAAANDLAPDAAMHAMRLFHENAEPLPMKVHGIDVPELLEEVVRLCLHKDPVRRPSMTKLWKTMLPQIFEAIAGHRYVDKHLGDATYGAEGNNNRAVSFWTMGDFERAVATLDSVLAEDPVHLYAWLNRATLAVRRREQTLEEIKHQLSERIVPANATRIESDPAASQAVDRIRRHRLQHDRVQDVCWSPDGTQLVSLAETVHVWDVTSGAEIHGEHPWKVSHEGGKLAVSGPRTGETRREQEIEHRTFGPDAAATTSPLFDECYRFAIEWGWETKSIRSIEVTTGRIRQLGLDTLISFVAISPGQTRALVRVISGEVYWVDLDTGEIVSDGIAHAHFSKTVWHPDGKTCATVASSEVCLWDVERRSLRHRYDHQVPRNVWGPNVVLAEDFIVMIGEQGVVRVFNSTDGQLANEFGGHSRRTIQVPAVPGVNRVAGHRGDRFTLGSSPSRQATTKLTEHTPRIEYSSQTRRLIVGCCDLVRIHALDGQQIAELEAPFDSKVEGTCIHVTDAGQRHTYRLLDGARVDRSAASAESGDPGRSVLGLVDGWDLVSVCTRVHGSLPGAGNVTHFGDELQLVRGDQSFPLVHDWGKRSQWAWVVTPDRRTVLVAGEGIVRAWNIDREPVECWTLAASATEGLGIGVDGKRGAASDGRRIVVFAVGDGAVVRDSLHDSHRIRWLHVGRERRRAIAASAAGLHVIETRSGQMPRHLQDLAVPDSRFTEGVVISEFSPDLCQVVIASGVECGIWDARNGTRVAKDLTARLSEVDLGWPPLFCRPIAAQTQLTRTETRAALLSRVRAGDVTALAELDALRATAPELAKDLELVEARHELGHTCGSPTGIVDAWVLSRHQFGTPITALGEAPGNSLMVGTIDGRLVTLKHDGRQHDVGRLHEDGVSTIAWAPDQSCYATGGNDWAVQIWHPSGGHLRTLDGHGGNITFVAMLDADQAITLASDGILRRWHRDRIVATTRVTGSPRAIGTCGRLVATSTADGQIEIWEANTCRRVQLIDRTSHGGVQSLAFTRRGRWLLAGRHDGTVEVLSTRTGRCTAEVPGRVGGVQLMTPDPSGASVVFGALDGTVRWHSLQSTGMCELAGHAKPITSCVFLGRGRLATASLDGALQIWHAERKWGFLDDALARVELVDPDDPDHLEHLLDAWGAVARCSAGSESMSRVQAARSTVIAKLSDRSYSTRDLEMPLHPLWLIAGEDPDLIPAIHEHSRGRATHARSVAVHSARGIIAVADDLDRAMRQHTVPAPASSAHAARLLVVDVTGNTATHVLGAVTTIGRDARNDIVLRDRLANKQHCRIESLESGWRLEDSGSFNGTFRRGERLSTAWLASGDEIQIGSSVLRFLVDDHAHEDS